MKRLHPGFALMMLVLLLDAGSAAAQPKGFNYDEARVPKFELPDPLVMNDGSAVKTAEGWSHKRRAEVLELFKQNVYGVVPPRPADLSWEVFESDDQALGGIATRKQVTIYFSKDKSGPQMDLLVYLPNDAERPVPTFVGLNRRGNHQVHSDPNIRLATLRDKGKPPRKGDASKRGARTEYWQVEMIVKAGFAVGTAFQFDVDPDFFDEFQNGVHALYPELQNRSDNFSSIGAWAWGLSRALDYFEQDDDIDASRVAVLGHSRLGKTALWTGAVDERFAIAISNCSGCGGAALSKRRFGETVKRINTNFPHWFCEKFRSYNDKEDALPLDQHMLIAMMAPRPVYISSAEDDKWADPRGEFLSGKYATPVYRLFGKSGFAEDLLEFTIDQPVHTTIGHHIRKGRHEVNAYDWQQYLKFAELHFQKTNDE